MPTSAVFAEFRHAINGKHFSQRLSVRNEKELKLVVFLFCSTFPHKLAWFQSCALQHQQKVFGREALGGDLLWISSANINSEMTRFNNHVLYDGNQRSLFSN